jgi:hypothetical protein
VSEVEPIPGLRELVLGVPCLYVLVWIWVSMLKERTGSRAASIAVSIMNAPIYIFAYTAAAVVAVASIPACLYWLALFSPLLIAAAIIVAICVLASYVFDFDGSRKHRAWAQTQLDLAFVEEQRKRAALAEGDTEIRPRQQAVAAG